MITKGERYEPTPNGWLVEPTASQVRLFTVLDWSGLLIVAAVGVGWLLALWRGATRGRYDVTRAT